MTCEEMEPFFIAAQEGTPPTDAEREHLKGCADCRQHLLELTELWKELEALPVPPSSAPPPAAVVRDLDALREVRKAFPALTFAILLLVGWFGVEGYLRTELLSAPLWQGPLFGAAFLILGWLGLFHGVRLTGMRSSRVRPLVGLMVVSYVAYLALTGAPAGEAMHFDSQRDLVCLTFNLSYCFPLFVLVLLLLRRTLMPTPAAGAMIGAGIGLVGAGLIHLHCDDFSTAHLLFSHGGALASCVVVSALLGALLMPRRLPEPG